MFFTTEQLAEAAKVKAEYAAKMKKYDEDSVDNARERFHNARERLAQVEEEARHAMSNRMLTHMRTDARTRHISDIGARVQAANDELREAEKEIQEATLYAGHLHERKQTREMEEKGEKQRKQAQAKRAEEEKAQTKTSLKEAYLLAGGTPSEFDAAWPGLWKKELEKRMHESQTAVSEMERHMLASGRYAF